uniref:Uncharacterized protein n=1 Tax=Cacopsylla melanoneura TaxID=428564 RepID=A0A8D8Z7R6_9HEMI
MGAGWMIGTSRFFSCCYKSRNSEHSHQGQKHNEKAHPQNPHQIPKTLPAIINKALKNWTKDTKAGGRFYTEKRRWRRRRKKDRGENVREEGKREIINFQQNKVIPSGTVKKRKCFRLRYSFFLFFPFLFFFSLFPRFSASKTCRVLTF